MFSVTMKYSSVQPLERKLASWANHVSNKLSTLESNHSLQSSLLVHTVPFVIWSRTTGVFLVEIEPSHCDHCDRQVIPLLQYLQNQKQFQQSPHVQYISSKAYKNWISPHIGRITMYVAAIKVTDTKQVQ